MRGLPSIVHCSIARPYGGLQHGAVKLAISQQRHGRIGRDQRLQAATERAMLLLGRMALLALDHRPQHWNGTPTIDHAGHQDHTAASGGRAIAQDGQGQLRQSGQKRASKRQPARGGGDVLMLDEAPVARDQTFVLATADGGVAGEFIELDCCARTLPQISKVRVLRCCSAWLSARVCSTCASERLMVR